MTMKKAKGYGKRVIARTWWSSQGSEYRTWIYSPTGNKFIAQFR